ncbi:MAG: pyridoxal phosphate-dependent aminotransferase [Candidatus Parvarchaeota archaeon]|nr:pyridoxal phosphate-dependent aminotransferase [Candidatus Jingweiarchaeum tengchongense]MCW1298142.1 pyridoxal phosphate-dependent aminotransferase [Candidatus Jingweiarchaeum tengchongense]MCW1299941.1 pyridoxal phosphate-dependent aminotransferase [Candidatus Jingweiarchaeum tengchongense]MCW1305563.1 pyridoxal phosphate-dependent aminotransferase [Candidatus Jingweiarchaeum tengchongense]MCW1310381.1 pyridoxal phosphate-dependent aminotransferase [Candidatus Jingweiarchaeum tengchongense
MKPTISSSISSLKASPIREIATKLEILKEDPELIGLGGGEPSLDPPDFLLEKAGEILKNSKGYCATAGFKKLRQRIAECMKEEGFELTLENILITNAASNGISVAFKSLINPGDEVITILPTYVAYPGLIQLNNAKMVEIRTGIENNFRIDIDELNEKVNKGKTKAIIVISPDNPTGRILNKKEVRAIGEIAKENGMAILSDEAYYLITYNGKFEPFNEFMDNLVGIRSFSKTASAPQWRIGYNYANKDIIDAMIKANQYDIICPNVVSQKLIIEFLKEENRAKREAYTKYVVETYKKRMEAMGKSLEEHLPEADFVKPDGAFYYFVRIPGIKDDAKFVSELLDTKKVAIVQGSAFGMRKDEGYFRLTFVSENEERINEGIKKIAEFLKNYKN